MVSIHGISLAIFTIIGRGIIRWNLDLHQNVASNALHISIENQKLIIFDQIILDCIFLKSCFPTCCMVSHIASQILHKNDIIIICLLLLIHIIYHVHVSLF